MQSNNNDLLNVLKRQGVLINVSVRYWRGCKKLSPEDLGLQPGTVSDRLISLGHKRLLPREATAALSLIESRAHALIEANTFPFLSGLAHFLPNPKLEDVAGRLKGLEREFWLAKSAFLHEYGRLRQNAVQEWQAMAQKLVEDPERLVATIEASYPPSARMDRFFGFDCQMFQISVPERLGLDLVALEDQQQLIATREQATRQAAEKIRRDTERFVAESIAALREQTATLCQEMLQSIQTGESGVHQRTLNRLIRFIDQFKEMNFANDTVMEQQLESVRKELLTRSAEEYRDSAAARQRLVQGLSGLREQARALAAADTAELVNRFGELGRRKFHLAA